MTLSLREKILLYILALLLSMFLIYKFVYVKAAAEYASNKQIYAELSKQYEFMRNLSSRYGNINEDLKLAKDRAAKSAAPFFSSPDAEKINLWLNKIIVKHGLTVISVKLSEPKIAPVDEPGRNAGSPSYPLLAYYEAFTSPGKGAETPASKPASSAPPAQTPAGQSKSAPADSVLSVSATLSMKGPVAAVTAFCGDVLNSGKTAAVRAIAYSFETENDRQNNYATISATLVFYSVPKASDDAIK